MAFDFVKRLFMTNEEKAKESHIMMLAKTALADGKLDEAEIALFGLIAKREGFSENEIKDFLGGKKSVPDYVIPESEEVRIQYLKDMAAMMLVDGKMVPEEMKLCLEVGDKLGLSKEKITEIMTEVTLLT